MAKATNGVKMSKSEFMAEHKELLSTLKSPTKSKLAKEYKEQSEEVKQVKKGPAKGARK